jgi:integrase
MRAAWALAIVVGARRGEIAGLKWSRIDLDRGVLYLHWQRTTTSIGVVEKAPKGKSKRTVAIGPALVAELRAHRDRQGAEKDLAGVVYHDRDYVFCKENGEPYYPRYFTDEWARACVAAGCREERPVAAAGVRRALRDVAVRRLAPHSPWVYRRGGRRCEPHGRRSTDAWSSRPACAKIAANTALARCTESLP